MIYRLYLCHGPHCCARGAARSYTAIETALWEAGLLGKVELMASGCQDHCDHGPNLLVQPGGCRYVGVGPERAAAIVFEHIAADQPVAAWLATPEMRRKAQ